MASSVQTRNRPHHLVSLIAGLVVMVLPQPAGRALGAESPAPRRPNVVYIFSDEHRWQAMSFTEMPSVRTPNLKRLAEDGFAFTHCISNYPVCSPYRAMLMTGRWPYQTGVTDNSIRLKPEEITIGKVFKTAGYATGYIGKWHLGGTRAEPFGFDHSLIWANTNNHWQSTYHPLNGPPVVAKGYNATLMTDQALAFIDKNRHRPFLLMLSWNPPHAEFKDAPQEYKDWYADKSSLPYRPNVETEGKPKSRKGSRSEESPWQQYRGYHAHISAIDAELGRILQKLDELDLARDTIVVYSSDHGSMQGSHGLHGKRQPFEESIRVPFLVRWPAAIARGTSSDALLGSIDIMPSLCGLAGIAIPKTCAGLDFSPAILGKKGPEPASQFIMHISKENASGGQNHPAPLFRGIVTKRYTYAVRADRPWCLFDNLSDPYQTHNLIDQPDKAQTRQELQKMLAEWLKKAQDPFVIP